MAVRILTPQAPPDEARLKQAIIDELRRNDATSGQPIIQIESTARGTIRIVVVWDDWQSLDQSQRSKIIMDAFEEYWRAEGKSSEILKVTIAMGLTSKEADRLGVT